jgi:hypothetical protein
MNANGANSAAATQPSRPAHAPEINYRPGVAAKIGNILPFRPVDATPAPVTDVVTARAAELSAELTDIRDSKAILLPELRRENFAGSALLIARRLPECRAIAERFVAALVALNAAWCDHQAFIAGIERQGASTATLRRLVLGDSDPARMIAASLRLALEAGHVEIDQIPPEILKE